MCLETVWDRPNIDDLLSGTPKDLPPELAASLAALTNSGSLGGRKTLGAPSALASTGSGHHGRSATSGTFGRATIEQVFILSFPSRCLLCQVDVCVGLDACQRFYDWGQMIIHAI